MLAYHAMGGVIKEKGPVFYTVIVHSNCCNFEFLCNG